MLQYGGLHLERSHLLTGSGERECTQVDQGFAGSDDVARFQQRWCYGWKTPYTKFVSAYSFFFGGNGMFTFTSVFRITTWRKFGLTRMLKSS